VKEVCLSDCKYALYFVMSHSLVTVGCVYMPDQHKCIETCGSKHYIKRKYCDIYICALVGCNKNHIKLQGTYIKIGEAQQARIYNSYKNTKLKLLKMNAAIWYNKICKTKQLMPKYIHIKINSNNMHSKNTKVATTKYRLNLLIKFLYCKK
jgi:hypothetical protein